MHKTLTCQRCMHHRNEATTAEFSFPIITALVGFPFASVLIDKSHFAGDSLRPKRWVSQERLTGDTPSSYYHPKLLLLLLFTIIILQGTGSPRVEIRRGL